MIDRNKFSTCLSYKKDAIKDKSEPYEKDIDYFAPLPVDFGHVGL